MQPTAWQVAALCLVYRFLCFLIGLSLLESQRLVAMDACIQRVATVKWACSSIPHLFDVCSVHSLTNKTVVQLRPKSKTGSSFLLEYIRYFCRRVWSITPIKFFRSTFLCELSLCPFMLNISLILLHKWFCWCRYRYIVVILVIPYVWRGMVW